MRKARRRRRRKGPSLGVRLRDLVRGISWLRVGRGLLNLAILSGLIAGAAHAMPILERYVRDLPEYDGVLSVELVDPPAWLKANPHIADRILDRCGVNETDRRLTEGLARRVAGEVCHVGWVKKVHEVSVGADDVVRICCDYREPIGWVAHGSYFYLIDNEQVRLPGRYRRSEVTRDSGLLLVLGVKHAPPAEGTPWPGDDLSVALRMIRLLRDKPYVDQVSGVIVANYGGRHDLRAPHIELTTDRDTRIHWGRAPGEEIDEPTAAQKLAQLQGIWQEYDRIDMGRQWVDIQIWPDRVRVPVASWQGDGHQRS